MELTLPTKQRTDFIEKQCTFRGSTVSTSSAGVFQPEEVDTVDSRNVHCFFKIKNSAVPFNTSDSRFKYTVSSDTPSAAEYYPRFRKNRILNGTSLRFTTPRICQVKRAGSDPLKIRRPLTPRKQGIGLLQLGKPPRGIHDEGLSVPTKGFRGFQLVNGKWCRVHVTDSELTAGSPSKLKTSTLDTNKGTAWSQRTELRFQEKQQEIPGPGEYDLMFSPAEIQKCVRSGRQLRYLELLQDLCLRENLPGPASYYPSLPKSKTGKHGTFSLSKRQDIFDMKDIPAPNTYSNKRTAFDLINKCTSLKGSPFLTDAKRFLEHTQTFPGPSDYNVKGGLYFELKKRNILKYSTKKTAFLTSPVCDGKKLILPVTTVPDVGHYDIQKTEDCCKIKKPTFGKCPRFKKITSDTPNCTQYDIDKGFSYINNQQSHLRSSNCSFLSCSKRELPKKPSFGPGPDAYSTFTTSLRSKGGIMPCAIKKSVVSDAPPPTCYFQEKKVVIERKPTASKRPEKKVLRTFTDYKYATGHCHP